MRKLIQSVKKTVIVIAKKSAYVDANTACTFVNYQPEEPPKVKKMRRF